jgi:septum formation protein
MKAQAVANQLRSDGGGERALVLGCDSVLEFEGRMHGKPADPADAARRWRRMRGQSGTLHTGHCLIDVNSGASAEEVGSTGVTFADVSDDDIDSYVATGEPLAVAGAFTIDGLGGWFVERIDGDHGNVVGVSLPVVRRLLASLGHPVAGLWQAPSPSGA